MASPSRVLDIKFVKQFLIVERHRLFGTIDATSACDILTLKHYKFASWIQQSHTQFNFILRHWCESFEFYIFKAHWELVPESTLSRAKSAPGKQQITHGRQNTLAIECMVF